MVSISNKFIVPLLSKISPHLKHVAALPREIFGAFCHSQSPVAPIFCTTL